MTSVAPEGIAGRTDEVPPRDAPWLPCIHAVTNDEIALERDFPARAMAIMSALGPRGAIHLRAHRQPGRRIHDLALVLAAAQQETGAWLVVNDRVDVALVAGALGVQLTSHSMEVCDARAIAPAIAVGASVHSTDEARAAAAQGASWAVAGHVFESRSHPATEGRGLGMIRHMAALDIPIIAIGGILPSHVPRLRAAGAYGVAAIRGIWDAHDAERAAIAYLTSHDAYEGA